MAETNAPRSDPAIAHAVTEVQGLFASTAGLEDAVARLTEAGFDHADLSLPEATPAASDATPEQGASAVMTETDLRQARTLGAGMAGSIGMAAAGGLTVATGGALAAAAAAGLVGGIGAGVLAEAAGTAAETTTNEGREQAARAGTLVLAARVTSAERQAKAEAAMRQAGATKVAAVGRTTAAIDSAGWTG
jgi:hypothetical protein